MLASFPASMLNQSASDLGILNRLNLDPFRSRRYHSAGVPVLLTPLPPADNLVVNTMNRRGQVLVKEARSAVADDDVAIGEWARIWIGHLR